jgi:hypothetical protein
VSAARHYSTRRSLARLGIVAILFQAILFGWHHHPLALGGERGGQPVVTAANSAAPLLPGAADDDCDICAALHHLTGAPGEFVFLALPPIAAAAPNLPDPPTITRAPERGFHARAPPRGSELYA